MDVNGAEDVRALVAFGKVGAWLMASKILSILGLFLGVGLGAYTVYAQSWQGVAIFTVYAGAIYWPSLKSERKQHEN